MSDSPGWIPADWPVPEHVHAGCSTRRGGVSHEPFDSLNLAAHVGDRLNHVRENRHRLYRALSLPDEPAWLKQIHGNRVIDLTDSSTESEADAAYTRIHSRVCAVLTADCLPLLLCNRLGTEIAAVHVGWRGFAANIIKAALDRFDSNHKELLAWVGPCISARHYETDSTVRNACLRITPQATDAFLESRPGHWWTSLAELARVQLLALGVSQIYGGQHCTYTEADLFYSWRRDGACGRVASLIWMDS